MGLYKIYVISLLVFSHPPSPRSSVGGCSLKAYLGILILVFHAGAIYCDGDIRSKGFNGEGIWGPSVLVTKTHNPTPCFLRQIRQTKNPCFGSAVLLVRNPKDALISEWHRKKSNPYASKNTSNHVLHMGHAKDFGMFFQEIYYNYELFKGHCELQSCSPSFSPKAETLITTRGLLPIQVFI